MANTKAPAENATPTAKRYTLYGVPTGYDSLYLARLAYDRKNVLHIATDDAAMARLAEGIRFFAPQIEVITFPAWDCLPYDRVSPTADIQGERVSALSRILAPPHRPRLILTTVAAATQRVPPRKYFENTSFVAARGGEIDQQALQAFLVHNGYSRTDTVREPGEYAVRGGLIDIFPSGAEDPVRIDLFGDEVETIRRFDPMSQRTQGDQDSFALYPVSEVFLSPDNIQRFRSRYREAFGAVRDEDPLYEAVSAGHRHAGMEHWLPFFYDRLETLFDYMPDVLVTLDHQLEQARDNRLQQVHDFYDARKTMLETEKKVGAVYNPIPVEELYLSNIDWHGEMVGYEVIDFAPFVGVDGQKDAGGRKGKDFGDIRAQQSGDDVFESVRDHVGGLLNESKKVLLVGYSTGACDRLKKLMEQHGLSRIQMIETGEDINSLQNRDVGMAVLGLEHGFVAQDMAVITEQDILGDRLTRTTQKKRKSDNFIQEISQLQEGDYVVHEEHGIGQFEKLETVMVEQVPHDCLKIIYAGGDKLFVPVENLDVLSRYGSGDTTAVLDKLGGAAWQARKSKVKKDLMAIAGELLKVAAARVLRTTDPIHIENSLYEQFCARFPYPETEDQLKSIADVIEDMDKPQAMDRLVCGDVGFGKTEVALRAAFVAAMSGYQVAVIAPTTLLCRQHFQNFLERFKGFPVRIVQVSRLLSGKEMHRAKNEIADGTAQIVIGTHALLGDGVKFNNLGLMIVDEEQRFGVKQKEKLKNLKENVHVLTLTATPIPRTLQMALTGVRELSLITTPPVDRLAVRTFVLPFDPVVIREALMREHFRGGQSFYVCPRIADMPELEDMLKELVPELKVVAAHGQMRPEELETKMTAFYDGQFDVLLSTNIVESGLDIPNANTMILHRSEMFGLAQMYQLRGRIGRSKQRAYAYLTYEASKKLTKSAEQRLHAISQLDTLGAGFQLASYDMDIRGSGNLLGEEQSGHIREIGVELYQQMLEEAVAAAREGSTLEDVEERWSPHISLGMPVLIPEDYIPDMNIRLTVYRKVSDLPDKQALDAYAAEMIDRFGPLPDEVENLLKIVEIKQLCRVAGIEKIEAGPKGALVTLHSSSQIDIQKLVMWITQQAGAVRLRPEDQKLVFVRSWDGLEQRVRGVHKVLNDLIALM